MIKIIQAKAYLSSPANLGALAKGRRELDATTVSLANPELNMGPAGWIFLGDAELHIKDPPDREKYVALAVAALDKKEAEKIKELNAELQQIRKLKSELLAIGMVTASPEEL